MAHKKSPRKRKPAKSGHPTATSRVSRTIYPKRFLVTPVSDYDNLADFFTTRSRKPYSTASGSAPSFSSTLSQLSRKYTLFAALRSIRARRMKPCMTVQMEP